MRFSELHPALQRVAVVAGELALLALVVLLVKK
jgi:hypothetical protein